MTTTRLLACLVVIFGSLTNCALVFLLSAVWDIIGEKDQTERFHLRGIIQFHTLMFLICGVLTAVYLHLYNLPVTPQ